MAYRRRRYQGSYTNWRAHHSSKRERVAALFGGIDEDIRTAFFNLSPSTLEDFFTHYQTRYGASAASYARKTYTFWKSGETNPSGQTSERLLEALPSFLSLSVKCDLLRKLREHYKRPESHAVTVSIHSWRESIKPLVERLIHRAYTAELPETVSSRLQWLSSGNMLAANAMLAEVEAQAAMSATAYLEKEFSNIERLMTHLPANKVVQHSIVLPYGTIAINVNRNKTMNNDEHKRDLAPREQGTGLERQTPGGLLQDALKHLDRDQIKKLSETAAEHGLSLEAERVRGERRFENASRDMDQFVEQASRLDRSQASDYKMQAEFESASGRTNVQVSKSASKVTVIIAIVIALVLLLLFASSH